MYHPNGINSISKELLITSIVFFICRLRLLKFLYFVCYWKLHITSFSTSYLFFHLVVLLFRAFCTYVAYDIFNCSGNSKCFEMNCNKIKKILITKIRCNTLEINVNLFCLINIKSTKYIANSKVQNAENIT